MSWPITNHYFGFYVRIRFVAVSPPRRFIEPDELSESFIPPVSMPQRTDILLFRDRRGGAVLAAVSGYVFEPFCYAEPS